MDYVLGQRRRRLATARARPGQPENIAYMTMFFDGG
jgi:hypothetical protein